MVKRSRQEDVAGVLEFKGRTGEDLEIVAWLAEHRAKKGGKIRVSQGGTGVRIMFSEKADLAAWKTRAEKVASGKKKTPAF
jgi:hypothetical protein